MKQINLLLLLIATVWLQGCAVVDVYNVRGTEGKVVDKETGQPLEGVMVVEAWEIYKPGLHGTSAGYLPLREVRTDSNGRYRLSARGTTHVEGGYLDETSPWLIFFKPGYAFTSVMNEFHPDRRFEFIRKSDWDGKAIKLKKYSGNTTEQTKNLEQLSSVLGTFTSRDWCTWTNIPRTLLAIYTQHKHLLKQGELARVAIGAAHIRKRLSECSSSDDFNQVFENEIN